MDQPSFYPDCMEHCPQLGDRSMILIVIVGSVIVGLIAGIIIGMSISRFLLPHS